MTSSIPNGLLTKSNDAEVTSRRSANFDPSIWGDHFLAYASDDATEVDVEMGHQLELLKEKVREMLVAATEKPSQKLNLIDAIQRLGVAYHFETDIDAALQHIYETNDHQHHEHKTTNDDNLYNVALTFRLLRQQGHYVSCDLFNKFKDTKGNFQKSLPSDARGMLSFYEATHLRVHGEDILDEALTFTTTHLKSSVPNLSNSLGAQVIHALNQPIHKGIPRLESRRYISFYEQDDSHDETLLDFAKLNFNQLQKLHQRELSKITRWWKDIDVANKLPFVRDRVVECYFWALAFYFEPQYLFARRTTTKMIAVATIIDDIYDVYGTFEELVLFTNAVQRWETSAMDELPEYMKLAYQALLDLYNTTDEEMAKEGRSYQVDYAKSVMKTFIRSYFDEAKWLHGRYVPSMEEYMRVAKVSAGGELLSATSFVGMGELATKEAFDWVTNDPLIVQAAGVNCRLMDDMGGHKVEQERGHIASAVECYVKQHGATEEEALVELKKQVENAWKDTNEECLHPTAVPMPLLIRILNLARLMDVTYKDGDIYTRSGTKLKDIITSLLVESVPIN